MFPRGVSCLKASGKSCTQLPAYCIVFLPIVRLTLIKEFLGCKSTNELKTCPSQSGLHSSILICSITINQNDSILTNQDSAIGTNQTKWIWIPYLHINRPMSDGGGHSSLFKPALLPLQENTLSISM